MEPIDEHQIPQESKILQKPVVLNSKESFHKIDDIRDSYKVKF